MERTITDQSIASFKAYLYSEEKSDNTIAKYLRDIKRFAAFAGMANVDKTLTMAYKASLLQSHAISSANSMIAAMNTYLRYMGWQDACVRQCKVQRQAYCSEEKELTKAEYARLVNAAKQKGNERLNLIIQTICGTGIRVSELQFITVEAVRRGEAVVRCKGKTRSIFIVKELRQLLLKYAKRHGICTGTVFVTKTGKQISRSNIWKEMKDLCKYAMVAPGKVFPHNLRHLFARTFYGVEKDIAKLADVLGHTNINTTRIYLKSTGAEHRRKLENMRLIFG